MENVYLFIIVLLFILAIADLIVGVSNDAVNFLNSAIGSKAWSFRKIMIFASFGIALGAIFSSGMMEVARKGIFNPSEFYFNEIIYIFIAVMMTDILLLDFFNTLGMPTSTTVSIVFELLGAAVVMALIKIFNASGNLGDLYQYINTDKAIQIILGIVLSVFIAFSIGALVQWVSRVLLSFRFEQKSNAVKAFFGGVSLAAIFTFILVKGIKGSPIADYSYGFLNGHSIRHFIEDYTLWVNLFSFVFWYGFSYFGIRFLKIHIYKLIIAVGTFALALAFAGNDLVNFIGVPIAAYQSYLAWIGSGVAATDFSMDILATKVPTPTLLLLGSGFIMVLTLWFSSKAQKVVKTSLDLSNQHETRERFKPNFLSRFLVRSFTDLSGGVKRVIPERVQQKIETRFVAIPTREQAQKAASFDSLRASINLVVAAVLISLATSLKLPLSTTYVTFMVAMGTSLADRAWGADSAVYRVAGVLNVIGGWFITALCAFTVCGSMVYLISIGGVQVIAVIMFIILLIVGKNYLNHRSEKRLEKKEQQLIRVESQSFIDVIEDSNKAIANVLKKGFAIYHLLVEGLSKNELKKFNKANKQVKKLSNHIEDLRNSVFYFIKNLDKKSLSASKFYISLLGILHYLSEDLQYLSKISYNHVNNQHRKLKLSQIRELNEIHESMTALFKEPEEAFGEQFDLKEFEDVLLQKNAFLESIENKIDLQINRTREEETSPKNTTLYFNFLLRTKEMTTHQFELIEAFFKVIKNI